MTQYGLNDKMCLAILDILKYAENACEKQKRSVVSNIPPLCRLACAPLLVCKHTLEVADFLLPINRTHGCLYGIIIPPGKPEDSSSEAPSGRDLARLFGGGARDRSE
ncbi:hypothetical protein UY3_18177 [Chelonia mydas]|uniref:Uncharacterized protein n=1 Tax=Chelonia mydas TaxID=8469 RepID=M7AY74_CHEMY|nr:hypothetical protein UY3_18177 [Chelonia mydas]